MIYLIPKSISNMFLNIFLKTHLFHRTENFFKKQMSESMHDWNTSSIRRLIILRPVVIDIFLTTFLCKLAQRDLRWGWEPFRERSSFVPWFSPYVFRDVSGTDLEWPWISGFRINSSSRDRAPKMRLCLTELLELLCYLLIFRRKMDALNPSKMDIKVLIPATTSYFTNTIHFLKCEIGK